MNRLTIGKFRTLEYACAEAVNTLCTNLTFTGENVRKIMITSCHSAEGKSYLSMNIMRTMATIGKTIALVDCDLRKSVITTRYGIHFENENASMGLAHLLSGKAELEDVIYETNIPGAYMVPVGRTVSSPLSLLNSPKFKQLLDYLAARVDYVLVDAAPVGMVIDAARVAESCDGTLLVVNYNSVRRQELLDAKKQLEQTECPILGTVLNMVEYDSYMSKKYYYRFYYKSYYTKYEQYAATSEDDRDKKKKKKRR